MAATATETASSTGVRYAPDDPSLPKPWRGLVDGKTGYLYFWNPETNVTQYEKPAALSQASSGSPYKSLTSSVQKSSSGRCSDNDGDDYSSGNNGVSMKVVPGAGSYQTTSSRLDGSHDDPIMKMGTGLGSSASKGAQSGASKSAPSGLSPEAYCRQHEISVIGDNVPQPFISFEATGLPSEILKEVRYLLQGGAKCRTLCRHRMGLDVFGVPLFGDQFVYQAGFSAPTPIQAQSWPIALQGCDIVAIAKTGSGKTLGYLIPGFIHLKQRRNNPKLGPTVLVLSPTRELATQIQDEAMKFGKSSKISCTCLYGGAPKGPQLKELDRGLVDVVVATPGRLNDILEMGRISLHQISYLVLDEADRMLDMGFEPQIRKIVKNVPTRRQTLMYTATWPKEVRKIASDLLVRPVQVNIGNVDELVANKAITQNVEVLSSMEKRRRLEQILRSQEPGSKIIIFCSTKKMCDQLAGNINHQFGAAAIHGDKTQSERDHVLNQFRTGRTPVLVATDVAARGLDIKDIRVVINYDFPTGIEDYVHRIGRTGRAGATGLAYTFFSDQDAKHASDLVKILEGANQQVPVEIRDMASRGGGGGFGGARRQWGSGSGGRDGGHGGRYDSGYGGRDGGRGGSHGYDCDQQEGYGYRSHGAHDEDALGSSHSKSFHESMMANMNNTSRSRSRSRSPNKNSGWGENPGRARSRSRSVERFDTAAPTRRSFHEMMMERAQPSDSHDHHKRSPSDGNGKETFGGSYNGNDKQTLGRSPPGQQQGTEELAD